MIAICESHKITMLSGHRIQVLKSELQKKKNMKTFFKIYLTANLIKFMHWCFIIAKIHQFWFTTKTASS